MSMPNTHEVTVDQKRAALESVALAMNALQAPQDDSAFGSETGEPVALTEANRRFGRNHRPRPIGRWYRRYLGLGASGRRLACPPELVSSRIAGQEARRQELTQQGEALLRRPA